jgi:hypothetical protein
MSKPALGRGLASLLQEETDRGAVKAPGLTPFKAAEPTQLPAQPEPVSTATPVEVTPAEVTPSAVVPTSVSPTPISETLAPAQRVAPSEPVVPPTVPTEIPKAVPAAPAIGAVSGSQPQSLPVPSSVAIPGWIVPALIAGDALVVLSAILWASWGQGWGRWPWIAALFAVGCTQAIAALFLSRSGSNTGSGPFSGRPPSTPGVAPGIRVRFVEEQPQSRRGDRR